MGGLVVVGADGSASSLAAVETAAREAAWRGAALRARPGGVRIVP